MIALDAVSARDAPLALASVTCSWRAGVHAVVGGRDDGGSLLLALVAGTARPRAGRVRVLDGAPTDAAVRTQIAFVPHDPALPDAMRVAEVLALAANLRGEAPRDPAARLEALGVASLAARPARSLSRAEARAVALAEAVTSARVRVILVEEPLLAVDPRALGMLPAALRARASEGCAVVVATGSARDAIELAEDLLWLKRGAATAGADVNERNEARVRVVLRAQADAQALVAALAGEEGIDAIERDGLLVRVRGRDATSLAGAAARAAMRAEIDVAELRLEPVRAQAPRDTRDTTSQRGPS